MFAQAQYFPESALGPRAIARLKGNWYTSQLRGLREPSLFALTRAPEGGSSAAAGMPCCTVGNRRSRRGTSGDASYARTVPSLAQIR